jgi:hypothetical protein
LSWEDRKMAGKGRKGGDPPRGAPGSYEWHNPHLYGSYDSGDPRGRTDTVNPSLAFKTDKDPMWTFRGMMRILLKRGFSYAVEYDGPTLGLSDSTRELVPIEAVLEALQKHSDAEPPFGGFRLVAVHDDDEEVEARLKVGGGTKVKLKVKGSIPTTSWDKIRSDVRKRYHVDV